MRSGITPLFAAYLHPFPWRGESISLMNLDWGAGAMNIRDSLTRAIAACSSLLGTGWADRRAPQDPEAAGDQE